MNSVVNDYVNKEINSQTKTSEEVNAASIQTVADETPITQLSTVCAPQVDAVSIQNVTSEQPIDQISDNNVNMTPSESQSTKVEDDENPGNSPGTVSSKSFYVKHEKPTLSNSMETLENISYLSLIFNTPLRVTALKEMLSLFLDHVWAPNQAS